MSRSVLLFCRVLTLCLHYLLVRFAGKSTLLKAIGARAVPIPSSIDIFFLSEEVEPSDTVTALDAVMSVDEERLRLEKQAEDLNHLLTVLADQMANGDIEPDPETGKTAEEQQEEVMDAVSAVYERLDALDASTAEVRARSILRGLGFTHEMQSKLTKDFSGGWRMRVSLARALFIQPVCLLLDEPTNHLDMEAVIWLEDYLSRWNRILLLVSHSQGTIVVSDWVAPAVQCCSISAVASCSHTFSSSAFRLFEQCVHSHDSHDRKEEAGHIRWQLRLVYKNKN